MATAIQVETYEVSEQTTDTTDAFDNEAVELIERLGLEGQRALLVKREAGGDSVTVRNPYRELTAEESRVFGTLCPQHTKLPEYGSSAIPLRVLQVAAHAAEFFETIEVWHPRHRVDDDPFLIGVQYGPENQYGTRPETRYLLARWGAELLPFDEMRRLACETLRRKWEASAKEAVSKAETFMASLDHNIEKHLSGDWVHVPS